jgi:hypothetical protein
MERERGFEPPDPYTRSYEAAVMFDASIVSDVLDFNTRIFPVRPAMAGCTTTVPDTPTVMSISPNTPVAGSRPPYE